MRWACSPGAVGGTAAGGAVGRHSRCAGGAEADAEAAAARRATTIKTAKRGQLLSKDRSRHVGYGQGNAALVRAGRAQGRGKEAAHSAPWPGPEPSKGRSDELCKCVPPERGGGRHGHARTRAGLRLLRAALGTYEQPSQWVSCGHGAHQDWLDQRQIDRLDDTCRHAAKRAPPRSLYRLMLLRRTRGAHAQQRKSAHNLRSTERASRLDPAHVRSRRARGRGLMEVEPGNLRPAGRKARTASRRRRSPFRGLEIRKRAVCVVLEVLGGAPWSL